MLSIALGAIIEELSSTHISNDSFYTDDAINTKPDRKTLLSYWMIAVPTPYRVADYVADFIASLGVGHIFLLPGGGGAMHLNDAVGKHPRLGGRGLPP